MKIALKIALVLILVLFAALLLAPVVFKHKITTTVQKALNKRLDATISVGDIRLSLLRNFPQASVTIEDLQLVGKDVFAQDTLLSFKQFRVTVQLWGLLRGEGWQIKSLYLEHPVLHAVISPEGLANWDILSEGSSDTAPSDTSASPFDIRWDDVRIVNGRIRYTDRQDPMEVVVDQLRLSMKGDLSSARSDLKIEGEAAPFSVKMGNITWISGAKIVLSSVMDVNLKEMVFTMKDSRGQINELPLTFEGAFSMKDDVFSTDLTFASEQNDFRNLLSLIPLMYQSDFKSIKTEGLLQFTGYIRGKVQGDTVPDIGAELSVEKAMFQYPSLPQAAKNIHLKAKLFYDGTGQDKTYVHIEPFHIEMAGNPFDATLHIQTPETNMQISGSATGKIDFTSLHQVIPIEGMTLKGLLDCNLKFAGFMSAIEKEEYEKFEAQGTARLTSFEYTPAASPAAASTATVPTQPAGSSFVVLIPEAQAQFTSRQITLSKLIAKIGNSEMNLSGSIRNYFPFTFKDGILQGTLQLQSNQIDLNEFMSDDTTATKTAASKAGPEFPAGQPKTRETTAASVIEIPKNIDLTLNSQIGRLLYDNLIIENVQGRIILNHGQAFMEDVTMNMLDGTLALSGRYDSRDLKQPVMDFQMEVKNFNILTTLTSFKKTLGKIFPHPDNYSGTISAQMEMQTPLDQEMSPILPLLTAKGRVTSNDLAIKNSPLLNAIGSALKEGDKFNNLHLNDINIPFEAKDNRITTKPFKVKLNPQVVIELYGDQGFDQTLNYTVQVDVPASYLGADVSKFLGGKQAASTQTLSLAGNVVGTLSEPKVKLNMEKILGSAVNAVAGSLLNQLLGSKSSSTGAQGNSAAASSTTAAATSENFEGLSPEKAAQAQTILDEANNKAAQIRQQGKEKADKIEADAAGKNMLQKAAARILAAQTRSDAEANAQKTLSTANAQIEQLKTK